MKIEKNKVVEFDYQLLDAEGELIEDTADSSPMVYLHGHGGILSGLERELEGRAPGDVLDVTLKPEQAYGYRDPQRVQRVPIKHLLTKGKLRPGMVAQVNTANGPEQVILLKVGRFNVDVDLNHPFAGLTLVFKINIISVRDASDTEIAHGHVHGLGGHHHEDDEVPE